MPQDRLGAVWTVPAFLLMYGKAMQSMPHLHSLELYRVSVDRGLLRAICALKQLTTLCLERCSFRLDEQEPSGMDARKFVSALSPLRLKEFSLALSPNFERPLLSLLFRIINPRDLERLKIVHAWGVTEAILSWIPENNVLKRLEIEAIKDVAVLLTALERCKCLEHLEVRQVDDIDPAVCDSLPALCLPLLRRVVSSSPVILRLVRQVA